MPDFKEILNWYMQHKRDLPWRNTRDPYCIWLSEIILQQTRVDQGLQYYYRFVENFPTIKQLAAASEEQVLKLWQGLGYYSRARNLHFTAQQIVREYNGIFPTDYATIRSLKGVGDYTAAAIASFAYDLPHACVDGNVYRVLARLFDVDVPIDSPKGKKEFSALATSLLIKKQPALFNQALMEFGAMQCVPRSPNCAVCVMRTGCLAYERNKIEALPVKAKALKQRARYFYYFFIEQGGYSFLTKRTEKDIWQHLYEFPQLETDAEADPQELLHQAFFVSKFGRLNYRLKTVSKPYKHVLSHQIIHARFVHLYLPVNKSVPPGLLKVKRDQLSDYAVSRLTESYLHEFVLGVTSKT